MTRTKTDVRTAQGHLINLGYLKANADGKLGPITMAALKHFQKEHHLTVNGKLNTATYNALVEADMSVSAAATPAPIVPPVSASEFYGKNPDFYGKYDQQYADPMVTAPTIVGKDDTTSGRLQNIPTRYGKIDVNEDIHDNIKRYNVSLNGQPILMVDDQPSVIGISSTYDLGSEDGIIFTTYHVNTTCPFKHYLMTLKQDGNNLQEISNCTRGYQARVTNGSLFVEFLESDDGRTIGNTWRYENGHLERL